ncbi:TCF21 [Branchiostoma lanceolatum]|uniref:TCF21 protein n=1 Tax=Branchiostoma lanceolatum TaxID=7740 RepID=A0A8J9YRE4_BRALA|nr:TCF21 [Branchiostoma lanceolatum]
MAAAREVRDPDTEGSGEQDLTPRGDLPSSPEGNPGKTRGRKRRRRKARLTGLSQQRQAANARERYRTKSVQDALQQLSCCIPTPVPTPANKLSKIEILRLASQYIEHLTNVLNENDPSGPGASKARLEDDTGTVKTKGSSRSRKSRSRQSKEDETVVYLTRRRMKDMQPEDKGLTDATQSNADPAHVEDDKSCQQVRPSCPEHDSNNGTTQNTPKEIITPNSGNSTIGSGSESRHCERSGMKPLQNGNKETGNGNSGRPYKVCELDVKLSEVESQSRRVVRETCAQVSCTKYAVRGPQCYGFRNATGNGGSGDKLQHPPYFLLNGNGVTGLPDCRHQSLNGFGVSHQTMNGTRSFTSRQMTDFATGSGASGFSDYSGFHCAVMSGSAQYGQNFSFESDDSNLSISR